jgi:hypothetical protein
MAFSFSEVKIWHAFKLVGVLGARLGVVVLVKGKVGARLGVVSRQKANAIRLMANAIRRYWGKTLIRKKQQLPLNPIYNLILPCGGQYDRFINSTKIQTK